MKNSINILIYDNINLIYNTYTFLFFETAADNLYVVGELLPYETSQQNSADSGNGNEGKEMKDLKSASLEIRKTIMVPKLLI